MTQAATQAYFDIQPTLRKSQQLALDIIRATGEHGATINDVERAAGRDLHQRVSELRQMGLIVETGARREGQTVWRTANGEANRRPARRAQKAGQVVDAKVTPSGGLLVTVLLDDPRLAPMTGKRATVSWKA